MVTKFLLSGRAQVSSALRAGPVVVGGPEPQPLPLRLFQKCVKDSSDVRETPSRGPFLFQDVVGLAQGLLGGGAQVKFPPRIPPARLRGWGLLENTAPPCLGTNDTWKLPADNRRVVNTGGWDRRALSFPKGNACTGREPRQDKAWLQQELTQTHREVTVYTVYTQSHGPITGLTSPTNRVLSTKQR